MKKLLLVLCLGSVGFAANAAKPEAKENDGTITLKLKMNNSSNSSQSSPRKSRLKFKDRGPTCLCADGLSEKDILEQQLIKQNK